MVSSHQHSTTLSNMAERSSTPKALCKLFNEIIWWWFSDKESQKCARESKANTKLKSCRISSRAHTTQTFFPSSQRKFFCTTFTCKYEGSLAVTLEEMEKLLFEFTNVLEMSKKSRKKKLFRLEFSVRFSSSNFLIDLTRRLRSMRLRKLEFRSQLFCIEFSINRKFCVSEFR